MCSDWLKSSGGKLCVSQWIKEYEIYMQVYDGSEATAAERNPPIVPMTVVLSSDKDQSTLNRCLVHISLSLASIGDLA
jgi:hypothetical protein